MNIAEATKPIDQPPPIPNAGRPVWELVIEDMKERDHIGRRRYGTPLQTFNGRDALTDAYQDALDLAVYLRQEIAERNALRKRVADLEAALKPFAEQVRTFMRDDAHTNDGRDFAEFVKVWHGTTGPTVGDARKAVRLLDGSNPATEQSKPDPTARPLRDLPFPVLAFRAFRQLGITTVAELMRLSADDFEGLRNFGPATLARIRGILATHGLMLRGDAAILGRSDVKLTVA